MSEKKKVQVILMGHESMNPALIARLVEDIRREVGVVVEERDIEFISPKEAMDLRSVQILGSHTSIICDQLTKGDVVLKTKNIHQTIRNENRFRSNQHRGKI